MASKNFTMKILLTIILSCFLLPSFCQTDYEKEYYDHSKVFELYIDSAKLYLDSDISKALYYNKKAHEYYGIVMYYYDKWAKDLGQQIQLKMDLEKLVGNYAEYKKDSLLLLKLNKK